MGSFQYHTTFDKECARLMKATTVTTVSESRKFLLFTSVGDKGNVQQWIGPNRTYDIALMYYGTKGLDLPVDFFIRSKDTKFPNLYKWLTKYGADIKKYSLVAVWDDDIVASVEDINKLFLEFDASNVGSIFSPCHTRGNYPSLFKNGQGLRQVDFVEMNAPVFKPDFLEQFMNGFDTNLKGYGTDVWFSRKCVNNCKIFVSDTTCVTNPKTRPDGTREIEQAQSEEEIKLLEISLSKINIK